MSSFTVRTQEAVVEKRRSPYLRLLLALVLIVPVAALLLSGLHREISYQGLHENREWLEQQVAALGLWAPLLFGLIYAISTALSLPIGLPLTLAGGFLFGIWTGSLVIVLGATLGAVAIFLAARTVLGDALRARAGAGIKRMEKGFRENALSYLLVLRLLPIFPFWLVNLVPAFLGVPLRTFVLGTFLGIIPGTVIYVSVGNGLGALLDSGATPNLGIVFEPQILFPLIGLSVLSLLPIAYKTWKGRRSGAGPGVRD